MTGRVIIVTGANSGLGFEVSRYLCEGGNDVILACRNEERANRAIEKIKRQNPNALATFMQLDLNSMESIRKFVDDFHQTEKKLNVLINNAGVMPSSKDSKKQYTVDNFEATMGTNHLGHFLLTNLLLEDLKKSGADGGDSRIVQVVSAHHDPDSKRKSHVQPLDFENFFLFNDGTYSGMQAYKNSKVAQVMTMYELARKLDGSGVTVNCVDPGFVPGTEIMRNASGAQKFFQRYIMHGLLRFTKTTRTVQQGAMAIVNVAADEKFKEMQGKYIRDGQEVKSSEESLDEEKQKKLWELSAGYVRLEGYDPIEVPPPPVEEEKKEEKKEEEEGKKEDEEGKKEDEEKKEDGEKKEDEKEEGDNKTDEAKTEEQKDDGEKKEEEKKEEEKEEDNKVESKTEEAVSENKEEEEKKE